MNRLDKAKQAQVVAALVEGNSIRATVRMTGVAKNTIAKLEFTPVLVRISGRMAYVDVHVTGTTTPKAGGAPRQQDNKGVFVLLQGNDGTWKTASYVLNSSRPAPTPTTPAR